MRRSALLSFILCAAVVSSQLAQAAQIEPPMSGSSVLESVVRNGASTRAAFPAPRGYSPPGNGRLYLAMGALAAVGVGLIAYGSGDSTRATGTRVSYCTGGITTQCGIVKDYDYVNVNRVAYKVGGAALIGGAVFGIYAIHKWLR